MNLPVKFRRTISAVVTVSVVATVLWQLAPKIHAQQQGNTMVWRNPATLIDEKARALNTNDSGSVQALADAVFNYPHVLGRMAVDMESALKGRLARAEAEFLEGKRSGVQEEDVVLVVNKISDKLGLPSFAKTSKKQVRALRMKMALAPPFLWGEG